MVMVHTTGHSHEKNNLDADIKSFKKINSKWMIKISIKQNNATPRK